MIDHRTEILAGLIGVGNLGAKAEGIPEPDLLRITLPHPAHINALAPDVLLILGGRGAGKSHLFRLLNTAHGPEALDPERKNVSLRTALWAGGFAAQAQTHRFPDELTLQQFAKGRTRVELMGFWSGLLVGKLLLEDSGGFAHLIEAQLSTQLIAAFRNGLERVSVWHPLVMSELESTSSALNQIDDALSAQARYLFIPYDDLDVTAVEWDEKRALIQSLLQYWLGQWRRWRRIRPKIFLRLDLFNPEFLQFADASKLDGNKVTLRWTPHQLYALTFKAWANQNDASRVFIEGALNARFVSNPLLGWSFPSMPSIDALRRVVHRMLGEFMGKNRKKGASFDWPPNHLQDALGEIFPRLMLNLFSLAAADEIEFTRAPETLLLAPESVAAGITQVSERRIKELLEEHPWLESVKPKLLGQRVPMVRAEMAALLPSIHEWGATRPLNPEPEAVIDHLLRIGVFRIMPDQRIHIPDIYLYGFGLKRSGGIRRPKL